MAKPTDYPPELIKLLEEHYGTSDWKALPSLIEEDLRGEVGHPPVRDVTKRRAVVFQKMSQRVLKEGCATRAAAREVDLELGIKSAREDWKALMRSIKKDPSGSGDKEYDRVASYLAEQWREKMRGSSLPELAQICLGSDDLPTQERVRPLYERLKEPT